MPSFPEALRFGCERLSTMVARYPPGARYARHRDALQRGRRLTAVYYLNPAWKRHTKNGALASQPEPEPLAPSFGARGPAAARRLPTSAPSGGAGSTGRARFEGRRFVATEGSGYSALPMRKWALLLGLGSGFVSLPRWRCPRLQLHALVQDDLGVEAEFEDPLEVLDALRAEEKRRKSHAATAGHQPVQELETVEALLNTVTGEDGAEGLYVDGTFGRGGHARSILARLGPSGRLCGFDVDPRAVAAGRELEAEDARFTIFHRPFAEMHAALAAESEAPGAPEAEGVLLDLGVSNNQADEGLRISDHVPVDMRLNPSEGVSASEWLQQVSVEELAWVIHSYGEEDPVVADRIAERVKRRTRSCPFRSLGELSEVIKSVKRISFPASHSVVGKYANQVNPAKRAINAIRVFLNRELQQLEEGLGAAMRLLKVGGRCAVLTFSPLERRVVHEFLRNHEEPPPEDVANLSPGRLAELFPLAGTALPFSVQRLTAQRAPRGAEYAASPRSRSSALLLLKKCPRAAPLAPVLPPAVRPAPARFREPRPPRLRGGAAE
ncbi:unnamed protein product [Effrenium voratum]|uniref:Prolyl 4-hydroxylase alpha subunit Fe(2+) 2OG dioxygenase domain-containing protein n=1 Tax=Effrenium voratum TaxID=2562239 RepID=A0AA36MUY0_9DINO|nr:unnamed protein product [Effrenium voratum]